MMLCGPIFVEPSYVISIAHRQCFHTCTMWLIVIECIWNLFDNNHLWDSCLTTIIIFEIAASILFSALVLSFLFSFGRLKLLCMWCWFLDLEDWNGCYQRSWQQTGNLLRCNFDSDGNKLVSSLSLCAACLPSEKKINLKIDTSNN
jgi:hypothetical protein